MSTSQNRILAYLSDALSTNGVAAAVAPDTELLATGLLDSMALVNLIVFIEQEFGVALGEGEMEPDMFETPARLAAAVDTRMGSTRLTA